MVKNSTNIQKGKINKQRTLRYVQTKHLSTKQILQIISFLKQFQSRRNKVKL